MDGNLSSAEMRMVSEKIRHDAVLDEQVAMGDEIDAMVAAYKAEGVELPAELLADDFEIPDASKHYSDDKFLKKKRWPRIEVAAVAAMAPPPDEENWLQKFMDSFKDTD
ncbi:MAG: hypothetical protein IKO62_00660 [Bacteroidales bacterium]|nr:hypothetical protein [Bacteroidales bacterium]